MGNRLLPVSMRNVLFVVVCVCRVWSLILKEGIIQDSWGRSAVKSSLSVLKDSRHEQVKKLHNKTLHNFIPNQISLR